MLDKLKQFRDKAWSAIRLFFSNTIILFKQNIGDIFCFSLFCACASLLMSKIAQGLCYKLLIWVTGVRYINSDNLLHILARPDAVLILFSFLIVMTYCSLFEIGGFLHAFSMAQVGRKTTFFNMLAAGMRTCRKAFRPSNWLVFVFILVLYPLTGIISMSNSAYKVRIPDFIYIGISENRTYTTAFVIIYLILLFTELFYLFAINVFVLQDMSFSRSCRFSRRLGKGHLLRTVCLMSLLAAAVGLLVNSISSVIITTVAELLEKTPFIVTVSGTNVIEPVVLEAGAQITAAHVVRRFLRVLFGAPIIDAGLTVLFFEYIEEKNMLAELTPATFRIRDFDKKHVDGFLLVCVCVLAVTFIYLVPRYAFLAENVRLPEVCAHRGDNVTAPDNSYEAFELAAAENVPWVELDLQMCKDGTVVVSHDATLKRQCGINIPIYTLTYEELQQYEMGDWMPGSYEHVKIPTFESVLRLLKENDMKVQVEFKPTGHEPGIEEEALRLINETGMHDNVMIICLNDAPLEKIRALDPTISMAHCAFMTWDVYAQVDDADALSVEMSAVTPMLVHKLHEAGKTVTCWTVDDPSKVQYLVSCGVDEIGTNDPTMLMEELAKADCRGGLPRIFHLAMNSLSEMEQ